MPKTKSEKYEVSSEDLGQKIKDLIKEGNVRKIIVKNDRKESVVEIPLNFGLLGLLLAPVFVAVGAMAALVGSYTIEVIRKEASSKNTKSAAPVKKAAKKRVA